MFLQHCFHLTFMLLPTVTQQRATQNHSHSTHFQTCIYTSDWMTVVGVCHNIATTQYTLPPGYQLGENDRLLYITK